MCRKFMMKREAGFLNVNDILHNSKFYETKEDVI